jgi:hypothetical protein
MPSPVRPQPHLPPCLTLPARGSTPQPVGYDLVACLLVIVTQVTSHTPHWHGVRHATVLASPLEGIVGIRHDNKPLTCHSSAVPATHRHHARHSAFSTPLQAPLLERIVSRVAQRQTTHLPVLSHARCLRYLNFRHPCHLYYRRGIASDFLLSDAHALRRHPLDKRCCSHCCGLHRC